MTDEQKKTNPSPTTEELVSAAYYPPRASKDVGFHIDHDPPPEVEWADGKVLKRRAEEAEAAEKEAKAEKNKSMKPEGSAKGYKTK